MSCLSVDFTSGHTNHYKVVYCLLHKIYRTTDANYYSCRAINFFNRINRTINYFNCTLYHALTRQFASSTNYISRNNTYVCGSRLWTAKPRPKLLALTPISRPNVPCFYHQLQLQFLLCVLVVVIHLWCLKFNFL